MNKEEGGGGDEAAASCIAEQGSLFKIGHPKEPKLSPLATQPQKHRYTHIAFKVLRQYIFPL